MTSFIPIFPLNMVVFPNEEYNLYIFEPRYVQLITECVDSGKQLGIPTIIDGQLQEIGSTVIVKQIDNTHDDGKMEITIIGVSKYRVLEVITTIPEKLYSGAIVSTYNDAGDKHPGKHRQVITKLRQLYTIANKPLDIFEYTDMLNSYKIAQLTGLPLKIKYEINTLLRESQRLEYLNRHLDDMIAQAKQYFNKTENSNIKKKGFEDFLNKFSLN
jgi:uncharacterized protein